MAIIITGDAGNNVLTAGSDADHEIYGLGGADTLTGKGGDDLLDGGTGADKMSGGLGNDTFIVDNIGDTVSEGLFGGIDHVKSSISFTLPTYVENLSLTGALAINGTGNSLNNILLGNNANNVLNGGSGADKMSGGLGSDTYYVDDVDDEALEIVAGGTDLVYSSVNYTLGAHVENLDLIGITAVQATGNDLNNNLKGNSANNVMDGKAGSDTMAGNSGNDIYYVDVPTDVVSELAGEGTDLVRSRASDFTLGANVENLDLLSTSIVVLPGGGIGVLPGGVNGTGNSGANTISGNSGANVLKGMGGNDALFGEGGNDTLDGGTGADDMTGGTGNDEYVVDNALDDVIELAGEGTDHVRASVTHTLDANVENLTLTGAAAINGTGNALANTLVGNGAANVLDGGAGADAMSGGAGNDIYIVDNAGDSVSENAAQGTDWVYASISETLSDVDVENLVLTGAAATNGTGNAANNAMYGNGAANTLMGLGGNDTVFGNGGNDLIEGGAGADELHGGTGNDTLRAVDNVAANDGATDRFHFDTALNAFTNVDLIDRASFTAAGGEATDDQIVLENSIFTALLSTVGTNTGTLGAAYYFEGGSNGSGQFDPVGIYNNTATGQLFYNPTFGTAGDSIVFAVVNLAGVPGGSAILSAEEFTLG
jgi:trimeric autotransporter adhesin